MDTGETANHPQSMRALPDGAQFIYTKFCAEKKDPKCLESELNNNLMVSFCSPKIGYQSNIILIIQNCHKYGMLQQDESVKSV